MVRELLIAVASLAEHRPEGAWAQQLQSPGSSAQAQYLRSSGLVAPRQVVGSFRIRDQSCLLHWQADSLPLSPQGSSGSLHLQVFPLLQTAGK